MTTLVLTLNLPEPVIRRLEEAAAEAQRPLADVAAQSIAGNLPPPLPGTAGQLRRQLLEMQQLSNEDLLGIAGAQVPQAQQARHVALLDLVSEGSLTAEEQQELAELREAADRLMLCKAHAWSILRWRGYPVPSLSELPVDEV